MNIIKVLKFILSSEHSHFISVDKKIYNKWKFLIILAVKINKNYKSVEIFRKKFKVLEDFVVIGLKYNGKNVKRRTVGFAKEFIEQNEDARCLYCDTKLTIENATADHIVPISDGGNNCQVNLVVCCKDCNNERGNLDFKYYLSKKNEKKLKNFI
jgi:CRISPR/Cas system Type II protein with McrA/HNH and RuvC-like nuclease domain